LKLSLQRDLEPIRQAAMEQVDATYAARMANVMDQHHLEKYEMAQRADPALAAEAEWRGVSLEDLCDLITTKHREAQAGRTSLDFERMTIKEQIRSATSEQAIKALVPGAIG
jgi:hypothetical protein